MSAEFEAFAFVAQTATLVAASLLLAYPVVAYARNVAHTRGLLLLTGALVAMTLTYVVYFLFDMALVSGVLDLTAALLLAAGVWEFARPFVDFGESELETAPVGEATGGFESAGDD